MNTSSTRSISKIFIYVLIIGGAFLMLVPFAWMVDTSFKAPSEVSSWPPVWTTKNAASSFQFKTRIKQKSSSTSVDLSTLSLSEFRNFAALLESTGSFDTLTVSLDDDPIVRGEIEILLLSNNGLPAFYAVDLDMARYGELAEKFLSLKGAFPQTYSGELEKLNTDDPGTFFDGFFGVSIYQDTGFIRRVVLVNSLKSLYSSTIDRLLQSAETTFKDLPIDNDSTKQLKAELREEIRDIFSDTVSAIETAMAGLDSYRTGTSGVTSLPELATVISLMRENISKIEADTQESLSLARSKASSDPRLTMLVNQFERSLESISDGPIRWTYLMDFYVEARNFYDGVQTVSLSSGSIVGRIRTDEQVHGLVIKAIDTWKADPATKEYLKSTLTPSNIRNAVTILLTYLDGNYRDSLAGHFSSPRTVLETVNEAMNFLRTSLLVAADPSLDSRVRQIMTSESSYQELESVIREVATTAGQSITYGKISAGLSRFAGESDPEVFARFIRRRWEETEMVGSFSKMHSNIFTELDLVSKPDEVEKVFLRGLISPSGSKSFDIKLKGIPAVWFKDDVSSAKANFTFAETIRNFFQNYVTAWNAAPFGTYYFNTVFVAIVTTFAEIIFAAMAAFAFAKMEFFGKNLIFTLFLATMMVPGEVLLVPNYITLTALGWIDSYYALIVPWVVSVFAIFLLRQHFMTIPNELYDAAMIDGLTKWRFLWTVMVPLSKPAVITGALLKFVGSWNSFLWVLIVTKSPEIRTLPVGLQNFSSATGSDYHLLMAAATFSVIPVVVLFLLTQKYFIAGIARSGLK
ncbi:MAG: ABC transporter permease subunit [Mesotoga sp.]|mgnify:FL=1|nr:ABC transporter permease subunit [Mesotoga sp.]MDI9376349.1 ABC transporter permease subunit [Thermotogota bacterium]